MFRWSFFSNQFFLFFAALIFFVVQFSLVAVPIVDRSLPVEVDDSFVYTLKAVQLEKCFKQDCQGLKDIWLQLAGDETSSDFKRVLKWVEYRYARIFFHVYHPAHSMVLVGIKSLGFDWVTSFDLNRLLGSILILFGIALWFSKFFEKGPAAIALILAAFTVFPDHGLHIVTPYNVSIGLALILWSYVIIRPRFLGVQLLLFSIFLLGFHPIAVVLMSMVWGIYFFDGEKWLDWRRLAWILFGFIIIFFALYVQRTLETPMFVMPLDYSVDSESWSGVRGYLNNIYAALSVFLSSTKKFGGGVIVLFTLPLVIIGVMSTNKEHRKRQLIMFTMLASALIVSMLFVFPPHSALLFKRLWIFALLFWFGILSQGIWYGIGYVRKENKLEYVVPFIKEQTLYRIFCVMTFVLVLSSILYIFHGVDHQFRELNSRINRHAFSLSVSQVNTLKNKIKPKDIIFYSDGSKISSKLPGSVPILFYFIHGMMDSHTFFEPLSLEKVQETNARYYVGWSPYMGLPTAADKHISLSIEDRLVLSSKAVFELNDVSLRFEESGLDFVILATSSDRKEHKLTLKSSEKWQKIWTEINDPIVKIEIVSASKLSLSGFRIHENTELRWPWGEGVRLQIISKHNEQAISFSPLDLMPGYKISILNDEGSTILAAFQ